MRTTSIFRTSSVLVAMCLIASGCNRTIAYGESTGFNLGIEADLATDAPAEVNVGFRRRVVGIVPPLEDADDGRVTGEAATILSRFEIDSTSNRQAILDTTVAVRGAFASGAAATELIVKNPNSERVLQDFANLEPVVVRVPDAPVERAVNEKLVSFISQSPENRDRYLGFAQGFGLAIPDSPSSGARALGAIGAEENASGNARIVTLLGL